MKVGTAPAKMGEGPSGRFSLLDKDVGHQGLGKNRGDFSWSTSSAKKISGLLASST